MWTREAKTHQILERLTPDKTHVAEEEDFGRKLDDENIDKVNYMRNTRWVP